jgi:hypothetical protein
MNSLAHTDSVLEQLTRGRSGAVLDGKVLTHLRAIGRVRAVELAVLGASRVDAALAGHPHVGGAGVEEHLEGLARISNGDVPVVLGLKIFLIKSVVIFL